MRPYIPDTASAPADRNCPSSRGHPRPELLKLLQCLPHDLYPGNPMQPSFWRLIQRARTSGLLRLGQGDLPSPGRRADPLAYLHEMGPPIPPQLHHQCPIGRTHPKTHLFKAHRKQVRGTDGGVFWVEGEGPAIHVQVQKGGSPDGGRAVYQLRWGDYTHQGGHARAGGCPSPHAGHIVAGGCRGVAQPRQHQGDLQNHRK